MLGIEPSKLHETLMEPDCDFPRFLARTGVPLQLKAGAIRRVINRSIRIVRQSVLQHKHCMDQFRHEADTFLSPF